MGELWYTEAGYFLSPTIKLTFKVKKMLHKEKSKYQVIEVIDTYALGKMLVLDGIVMFCEGDEFAYHEMLIHPAMVVHPEPKDILIIGGGDGGAVRELLKYPIRRIKVVDIDSRVTEVCKKFFPEMVKSFEDERVSLINQDGREYLSATQEVYDIIFVDSTDPTGPGISLVKEDFLLLGSRRLSSPFGIWVAQTESTMPKTSFLSNYVKVLRKEYPIVKVYQTDVPSYGGGWTFTFASKKTNPLECKRKAPSGLFYYNEEIHKAAFVLPEYLRKELE